ncbi:protein HEG homolog 1 isoform X2 [Mixophyes fleayi]|uniref:protein HEG homolog 1 isoform X2 n=1 Tax=Mixophyes fleayi TaxID=3061075 RepID=UPI003F4E0740
MMLPGFWLLLLGAAHCAQTHPDRPWSSPGTPSPSAPGTRTDPGETSVSLPGPALRGRAETSGLWKKKNSLEAIWTQTDPLWKTPNTGTNSLSEPNRTQTDPTSEPNRTQTDPASEPNRTQTDPSSEPNRTQTDPASEPNRTQTDPVSEPNRTQTDPTSEPNRTQTDPVSEPNRTQTDPTSEPNRTKTDPSSEPNRTKTDPSSEPNRTKTDPSSEPKRTQTDPTSEPSRTQTDPSSEPNRTQTDPTSEPSRTQTDPSSEPNRTQTDPPSEPNRTQTDPPSEPNRTQTDPPSEPNRTQTDPPSEPNRTNTNPSFNADIEKTQTISDHRGPHIYFKSEPGWTEGDFIQKSSQTSSDTGITQKSATRRHVNKRTPHMDTTFISTTFTRTLLSVTNDSNLSDITEIPTYTTALDSGSTNTRSHKPGSTTEDLGNTTQKSLTTAQDMENSTESSETRNTVSDSGLSVPSTYPLQTHSYPLTTYPPPTSHHLSNSTVLFTSDPVTASNPTRDFTETDVPDNNSSVVLSSSSSYLSSSSNSSLLSVESSFSTSTFPASSASFSSPVRTDSNQSSVEDSSSPTPSTFVFSRHSSVTQTPSDISPGSVSTKSPVPLTTQSTTPPLSSFPSLPPSSQTGSPSFQSTDMSTPHTYSLSPSRTNEPSRADNRSVIGITEPYQTNTEPGITMFDGTTPAVRVLVTTLQSEVETQMTITSTEDKRTQSVLVTELDDTPAQTTDNVPSTTTTKDLLIPSSHYTTHRIPNESMKTTTSESSTLATGDAGTQVMTDRTTRMDLKTVAPRLETTVRTKDKKLPAYTTSPPDIVIVKYTSTPATTPPDAAGPRSTVSASFCAPNPCHNGGVCVDSSKGYSCDCPPAWRGDHCDRDVDECLSNPCPAQTTCVNSWGSFRCQCPLGYILEKGAGCILVRTFLGHIEIPRSFLNGSNEKHGRLHQIEREILQILNSSFSTITGYYQSSVTNTSYSNHIVLTVQNIFSMASNVTLFDLKRNIQSYIKVCESALESSLACRLVLHPQLYYLAVSLCNMKNPGCDNETAECTDPSGVAFCQCKPGYFKYSKTDHSCRACDDGYKLENEGCVRCPFGLGGFNCSNPYQLITVIIAAGGGGVLLILVIALAVTCCRKSKHDISKLIFKSGDFQMSPYAEYPKAQRSSEWGRETIEMQENGSTKNLLQMTDIYYSESSQTVVQK